MASSKALVLHGPKDLRLVSFGLCLYIYILTRHKETKSISPPTGSHVQIAIRATGICGSDLHYYMHGRNGDFVVRQPMCLGHESAGIVTALGPDVDREGVLQVGDRVALEVGLPCRACALCGQGRYNLCARLRFRSSAKTFPHLDGTLMQLTNHPADLCHKLPANVSYTAGALVEPLAVCLHALRRSQPPSKLQVARARSFGEETAALVFGAGAIGLLLAAAMATADDDDAAADAAAVSGLGVNFSSIVVADIDPERLEIAKSLNLGLRTALIQRQPTPNEDKQQPPQQQALEHAQSLAASLKEMHGVPHGFSRVYDCTGVPACVQAGIYAAASGGVVVQIGMGHPVQTLPIGAAAVREVDLIGVFRYDGFGYPAAIALMASGRLARLEQKIVTHRLRLDSEAGGIRAFELAGRGVDENGNPVVKVLIES